MISDQKIVAEPYLHGLYQGLGEGCGVLWPTSWINDTSAIGVLLPCEDIIGSRLGGLHDHCSMNEAMMIKGRITVCQYRDRSEDPP